MESISGPLKIAAYKDGYRERVNALIASKLDKTVTAPIPIKTEDVAPPQDIMAALEASRTKKRSITVDEEPAPKKRGKKAA